MRIIDQSAEVLSLEDLNLVEVAARTCYKSEERAGIKTLEQFVKGLRVRGHTAMLEFATATVRLVTNRGVTHELVRHRLASYAQESTRYCDYGDGHTRFVRPVWCDATAAEMNQVLDLAVAGKVSGNDFRVLAEERLMATPDVEWLLACWSAAASYEYLRKECGWRPEQAREVLPNALKTEIVVKANLREWRHIFSLRVLGRTGRPHPQISALLSPLLERFSLEFPGVFDDQVEALTRH